MAAISASGWKVTRWSRVCRATATSYSLYGGAGGVTAGEKIEVAVSFGDQGFRLYVGGELVGESSYTGGITNNGEPLVVGADAQRSGDIAADNLMHFFDGTIHDLAIYDRQFGVADGADLDYEDATEHDVTVKVTDPGGLSDSASFTIKVGDRRRHQRGAVDHGPER